MEMEHTPALSSDYDPSTQKAEEAASSEPEEQVQPRDSFASSISSKHEEELMEELARRFTTCQQQTAGTELDLSHLQLTAIPEQVATVFPALRRLNLRANALEILPEDFGRRFPQLVHLNAANNQLTHVPESISACRHLQKLVLENNAIRSLPSSLGRLEHLEELNVKQNQLQTVFATSDVDVQWKRLKVLQLAQNEELAAIPKAIEDFCPLLKVVELSGNVALREVPDKIRRLHERNLILHSRSKRRELITRALRIRDAVAQHSMVHKVTTV